MTLTIQFLKCFLDILKRLLILSKTYKYMRLNVTHSVDFLNIILRSLESFHVGLLIKSSKGSL